jgi:hypothetical protein
MRAALLPVLALPLLLTYCGSKHDLVIGEIETAPITEGGSSVIPNAGSAGTEANAGGAGGTAGGSGGTGTAAGSGGESGSATEGGATNGGESGGGGESGAGSIICPPGEEPPVDSLIHRYSFSDAGTDVLDSVGTANGKVIATSMDGSGVLTLAGNAVQPDQYAELPDNLINSLSEVTFVVWTTWKGGAGYERILDFGESNKGSVQGDSGRSYIAVMTSNGFANGMGLGAEITAPGFATLQLASTADIKAIPAMVALTFRSGSSVGLFLDAQPLIESPTSIKLSDIKDVNNWLGQSQWSKDHAYSGTYTEFRIYNTALSACQLSTLFARGPDVP